MGTREAFFLSTADQSLAHEFTSFYFPCNEHCHLSAFILEVLIFSVRHWLLKLIITFQTNFFFKLKLKCCVLMLPAYMRGSCRCTE